MQSLQPTTSTAELLGPISRIALEPCNESPALSGSSILSASTAVPFLRRAAADRAAILAEDDVPDGTGVPPAVVALATKKITSPAVGFDLAAQADDRLGCEGVDV